jgi:uncharacterized protein YdcH (DUF465 family)
MEAADRELIERLSKSDKRIERLYAEHRRLETELDRYSKRAFLTSEEAQRERELKVKKLQGVDKLMQLVRADAGPAVANA